MNARLEIYNRDFGTANHPQMLIQAEDEQTSIGCACPLCLDATMDVLQKRGYRVEGRGSLVVVFQPDNSGLFVLLTAAGRQDVEEWKADDDYGYERWNEMWEPLLCNGWEQVGDSDSFWVTSDTLYSDFADEAFTAPDGWSYTYNYKAIRFETEVIDRDGYIYLLGMQEPTLSAQTLEWWLFEEFARQVNAMQNEFTVTVVSADWDGVVYCLTALTGQRSTVRLVLTKENIATINIFDPQTRDDNPVADLWVLVYLYSNIAQ